MFHKLWHITSDVHAPFDLWTPTELRGHTYRISRAFDTDCHGDLRKKKFEPKGHFRTYFKKFFQSPRWVSNDFILITDHYEDLSIQLRGLRHQSVLIWNQLRRPRSMSELRLDSEIIGNFGISKFFFDSLVQYLKWSLHKKFLRCVGVGVGELCT